MLGNGFDGSRPFFGKVYLKYLALSTVKDLFDSKDKKGLRMKLNRLLEGKEMFSIFWVFSYSG
jgi:hypothetical protein